MKLRLGVRGMMWLTLVIMMWGMISLVELKKRNVLKRFYLFRSPIKKNYKKYWIIIKMTA